MKICDRAQAVSRYLRSVEVHCPGCRWVPPTMMVADGSHQTAAQRGGEAKDKDKPLPDLQRDRSARLLSSPACRQLPWTSPSL